jgi:sortase A
MSEIKRGALGRMLRWAEVAGWVCGLGLILFYGGARAWSDTVRAGAVEAFDDEQAGDPMRSRSPIDQSLWSKERIRKFSASLLSPGAPEAVLRIPSVQLEVPVYRGTTELNLNRGAAHIEGTADLAPYGNVGLAAHRDGFFRALKDLAVDADIFLDLPGQRLRYRAVAIEIVMPTDVHVLGPTRVAALTLVTCYPFYFMGPAPQRYIVRAELADAPRDPGGDSSLPASNAQKERS